MEQQSMITGLTLFITVLLSVVTMGIPRKYILLPFVIGACWVPADQTLMIGELNFQVLRILIVVGMLRLWIRGEVASVRWNRFDKLILAWALVSTIVYILQWMTMGAVIFCCGRLLQWLGMYWVFRQSIRSWDDIYFAHVVLAVCALAMLPFVLLEWTSGSNPFGLLGRVTTFLRDGNYRCQATFPHAIMMGLFWVALVPLFVGFAKRGRHRWLFWSAVAAIVTMVWATASSTPILALAVVPVLLYVYRWRGNTRVVAWGGVFLLFALHLVMQAPVWHLVARVGVVSGSTGYHRYRLIDQAIRHLPEWALLGTRDTLHWGVGLQDVTNQYILEGVTGGLAGLILFCAVHFVGAKALLHLSLVSRDRKESYLAWCVFVTIVVHCISFIGVSYFGQITMIWHLLLASTGLLYGKSLAEAAHTRRPVVARVPQAGLIPHS